MNLKSITLRSLAAIALLSATALYASAWDEKGSAVSGVKEQWDGTLKTEECFPVKDKGLWGFVDLQGKVKIKPKYEAVGTPQKCHVGKEVKGFIPVKLKGKWGFVNEKAKECVKPQFDSVGEFFVSEFESRYGGKNYLFSALAENDGETLLINDSGKIKQNFGSGISAVKNIDGHLFGKKNGAYVALDDAGSSVESNGYLTFLTYEDSDANRSYYGSYDKSNKRHTVIIDAKDNVYGSATPIRYNSKEIGYCLESDAGYMIVDKDYEPFSTKLYTDVRNLSNY